MSDIERVEKAICCPEGCIRPSHCVSNLHGTPRKARAAIKAIREPSPPVQDAGANAIHLAIGAKRHAVHYGAAGRAWTAMISTILKEGE